MCFRVSRSTGAITGTGFEFRPTHWQEDLARLKQADEDGIIIVVEKIEYLIRVSIVNDNNNLDEIIIRIEGNERSWCDFDVKKEIGKLNVLRNILNSSGINNGEILSWGMANVYYDARDGCSYLVIYYKIEGRNIPEPIYNYNILP